MAGKDYLIHPVVLVIMDSPVDAERLSRLTFHIQAGDYFPFIATVLGFVQDTLADRGEMTPLERMQSEQIDRLRKDLIHIHEHYDLVPKETPLSYSEKKVVRFDA